MINTATSTAESWEESISDEIEHVDINDICPSPENDKLYQPIDGGNVAETWQCQVFNINQ